MRRRLLNLMVGVSLVLWLAVIITSIGSHSTQMLLSDASGAQVVRVHLKQNGIVVSLSPGIDFAAGLVRANA